MGWPKNLREQQRQRKRIPQELKATSPGSAQNPSATPGPLGINDSAQFLAQPSQLPPLEIHLELKEIIELNEIIEHGRSGLIRKGAGFAKGASTCQ